MKKASSIPDEKIIMNKFKSEMTDDEIMSLTVDWYKKARLKAINEIKSNNDEYSKNENVLYKMITNIIIIVLLIIASLYFSYFLNIIFFLEGDYKLGRELLINYYFKIDNSTGDLALFLIWIIPSTISICIMFVGILKKRIQMVIGGSFFIYLGAFIGFYPEPSNEIDALLRLSKLSPDDVYLSALLMLPMLFYIVYFVELSKKV
jgi:hypothetical protein